MQNDLCVYAYINLFVNFFGEKRTTKSSVVRMKIKIFAHKNRDAS